MGRGFGALEGLRSSHNKRDCSDIKGSVVIAARTEGYAKLELVVANTIESSRHTRCTNIRGRVASLTPSL